MHHWLRSGCLAASLRLRRTEPGGQAPNVLAGDTDPLDLKDQIFGLGGNDVLVGGRDADQLSGGTGGDIFSFQAGGPGNHLEADLLDLFTFHYGRILDLEGAGVAVRRKLAREIALALPAAPRVERVAAAWARPKTPRPRARPGSIRESSRAPMEAWAHGRPAPASRRTSPIVC